MTSEPTTFGRALGAMYEIAGADFKDGTERSANQDEFVAGFEMALHVCRVVPEYAMALQAVLPSQPSDADVVTLREWAARWAIEVPA